MATIKVLLDKRRESKEGNYPLVIRVYSGSGRRDIGLNTHLKEAQFDESGQKVRRTHPNYKVINSRIKEATLKLEATTLKLEMTEEDITAEKIKSTVVKPKPKFSFVQYGEKLVEDMRAINRNGNASAYKDAISALKEYSGKSDLQFKEVNYELLINLENKMLAAGLKKNSIAAYNRALRAIFNRAINEDMVELKHYPYRKYKIKGEATLKRNISKEAMKAISEMQLEPNSQLWHSRNYFMLSFNLRGISFGDMASIRLTDITNDRLIYKRKKTHKLYDIKLTDKAKEIISIYSQLNSTYILPVLEPCKDPNSQEARIVIHQAIKTCNKYLKLIGEELKLPQTLTTYFSRHSWATIAKKMGYSKDLISEGLGHCQGSRITEIYLDSFDQEVIDEMNERVCNG